MHLTRVFLCSGHRAELPRLRARCRDPLELWPDRPRRVDAPIRYKKVFSLEGRVFLAECNFLIFVCAFADTAMRRHPQAEMRSVLGIWSALCFCNFLFSIIPMAHCFCCF